VLLPYWRFLYSLLCISDLQAAQAELEKRLAWGNAGSEGETRSPEEAADEEAQREGPPQRMLRGRGPWGRRPGAGGPGRRGEGPLRGWQC